MKLLKIIILTSFLFSSLHTFADDTEQVKSFVNNLASEALGILKDHSEAEENKEKALKKLFLENVDTQWMGKFVLGKYYRTVSDPQKVKYESIYPTYLITIYLPNFRKYTSETIVIKAISETASNEYLVKTEIIRGHGEQPVKVGYMVRKDDGNHYKVFDIIGEGVSLVTTQRSEFGSIISTQGLDSLIAKLEARVQSIK